MKKNEFIHTKQILHVKYWSFIFSASRRTCCVISVVVDAGVDRVEEEFSSLFPVKVLNRSQTYVCFLTYSLLRCLLFSFLLANGWFFYYSTRMTSLMMMITVLLLFIWHIMRWVWRDCLEEIVNNHSVNPTWERSESIDQQDVCAIERQRSFLSHTHASSHIHSQGYFHLDERRNRLICT